MKVIYEDEFWLTLDERALSLQKSWMTKKTSHPDPRQELDFKEHFSRLLGWGAALS
jgi:hypothetical protein